MPDRKSNTPSTQPYIVSEDWLRPPPERAPGLCLAVESLAGIPKAGGLCVEKC